MIEKQAMNGPGSFAPLAPGSLLRFSDLRRLWRSLGLILSYSIGPCTPVSRPVPRPVPVPAQQRVVQTKE